MKSKFRLTSLCIFTLIMIGCQSQTMELIELSNYEKNLPSFIENEDLVLEMKSAKETYPPTVDEISFKLSNFGPHDVGFVEYYQLEKRINESWYKVPFSEDASSIYIEIDNMLKEKTASEITLKVEDLEYQLTEGEYRMIKEFWSDGNEAILASEFRIVS
ncbi:immunoglobulin-like domain-containing protein [Halalkalibacter kiskunsagensis]|uniref:Immunoglobulin-like domain-containing protein n=1 Tax=Halalkalibacter kiskunsagensis TaxID=1548599 RepID=A0ABV6KJZ5_9BACI